MIAAALIMTGGIASGSAGTDAAAPSPMIGADTLKVDGLSHRLAAVADASPNDDAFVSHAIAADLPMVAPARWFAITGRDSS